MDGINILVIISIIIGIIFIVLSFIIKDKSDKKVYYKTDSKGEDLISNTSEKQVKDTTFNKDQVMEEISNRILELNDYSSFIKQELNDKHKELLFLYQMISEKEKNIKKLSDFNIKQNEKHEQITKKPKQLDSIVIADNINDKNNEIYNLHKNGYSIADIAKDMEMSRREVKLILELGMNSED
jgi:predicted nuclease with TOPRIM domain